MHRGRNDVPRGPCLLSLSHARRTTSFIRTDAFTTITLYLPPPSQDPFKYSYPPLPDDDFQTPICDNGPIVSEDEVESKDGESEVKDALESSFGSEVAVKPKKVRSLSGLSQVLFKKKNKSHSQTR